MPTREIGLKNPFLICDFCRGAHEADETTIYRGNNKRKEKGENGPEWVVRNKFEDELANFMLEKKFHMKGVREMLDQHRKEMHEQFSQILSTIRERKFPEPEAPTFAITTRSALETPLSQLYCNRHLPTTLKGQLKEKDPRVHNQALRRMKKPPIIYFLSTIQVVESAFSIQRAKVLKDLLSHKEKLEKAASSVKLSEECSAIIQRSLPQKEGDPRSFRLPCLIGPLVVKNALADLGASINLMPHSLFRRVGISKLKLTRISIQLADRSIKYLIGVCENLLVKVNKFIFSIDFIVLEMDEDELILIILGRPFLATTRAVIDVHERKLSLRVGNETVTFNIGKSIKSKHSRDDYLAEPVEPLEWKALENQLKPSSIKPPELELKELLEHLEYAFLQENNQLPVVISSALSTVEKTRLLEVLKNHKGAISWSIADIKGID
ncbi:DNA-directed DNA polymerase [Tanacetum coccineum]